MIRRLFKFRSVRIAVAIYALLWALTAVVGNSRIDVAFDEQNRYGYNKMGSDERVEIKRLTKLYVRNLLDPRNESLIPASGLFRFRSRGVTVAPFVVIDEIGTVFAPLGGIGGIRLSLWFFGATRSWVVYPYWHV